MGVPSGTRYFEAIWFSLVPDYSWAENRLCFYLSLPKFWLNDT